MRSIEISTQTFSLIWSRRLEGEEDEDTILRRLLTQRNAEVSLPSDVLPESESGSGQIKSRKWGKPTWALDIANVLEKRGGTARLQQIYDDVSVLRQSVGRSVPPSLEATVRRTLEDHCRESDNFRGNNLFEMPEGKGAGVWALRR